MFMKPIKINAVGTSDKKIQGYLWNLRKAAKASLSIRPEKDEAHPNSLAVIAYANGKHFKVGYIPAKTAFWLKPAMERGEKIRCYRQKNAEGKPMPYVVGGGNATLGLRFAIVREVPDTAPETEAAAETATEAEPETEA